MILFSETQKKARRNPRNLLTGFSREADFGGFRKEQGRRRVQVLADLPTPARDQRRAGLTFDPTTT
jgi:hypothetical protein